MLCLAVPVLPGQEAPCLHGPVSPQMSGSFPPDLSSRCRGWPPGCLFARHSSPSLGSCIGADVTVVGGDFARPWYNLVLM